MKKSTILVLVLLLVISSQVVFSEPGSDRDPLVSKSYVDSKIEDLKSYIDKKINSSSGTNQDNNMVELKIVNLKKGEYLVGAKGTQIILRGGKATAYGVKTDAGIVDATQGVDIDNSGSLLPYNHLLIIPRDDGRGAYAQTDAIFMVTGKYTIK